MELLTVEIDGKAIDFKLEMKRSVKMNILSQTDFDCSDLKTFGELDNEEKLLDILWIMCIDQCNDQGITCEDFKDAFPGEKHDKAREVIVKEIVNFSPMTKRSIITSILETNQTAIMEGTKKLTERMPEILEASKSQVDGKIDEVIKKVSAGQE